MLNKNARLEEMYQRGFRPAHALWVDTYNKQFGVGVVYTIQAGKSLSCNASPASVSVVGIPQPSLLATMDGQDSMMRTGNTRLF